MFLFTSTISLLPQQTIPDPFIKSHLANHFVISDLGPAHFLLGYLFDRDRQKKTIFLHQTAYSKQLLSLLDSDLYTYKSPASSKPTHSIVFSTQLNFVETVGGLLYLSNVTRPRLSHTVRQLCRSMHTPKASDHQALLRLLLYSKGTIDSGWKSFSSSRLITNARVIAARPQDTFFSSIRDPLAGAVQLRIRILLRKFSETFIILPTICLQSLIAWRFIKTVFLN